MIFTPQERKALWFLLGISFLGIAVTGANRFLPSSPSFAPELSVSVNRAGASELAALPGIGKVLARRIVADRSKNGLFLTLADLKRVKGVADKTLGNLKGLVRFD
ncbi:MAG: helix-hairpin-helix domain-containing protein [Candidatus Omnitrophica bacterium]|nr:helix-hairpin-helix domain-containing protein [Candidatus Omnitrophota bacterium]